MGTWAIGSNWTSARYAGHDASFASMTFISYTNTSNVKEVVKSITIPLGTGSGTFTAGDTCTGSGGPIDFYLYANGDSKYKSSTVQATTVSYPYTSEYWTGTAPVYTEMTAKTITFSMDIVVAAGATVNFTFASNAEQGANDVLTFDRTSISGETAAYSQQYTLTLNAMGGSVSPSSYTENYNTTVSLPTPSKSYTLRFNAQSGSVSPTSKSYNCKFSNWNTKKDGSGTSYSAGSSYQITANATLYAIWTNPTVSGLPTAESSTTYTISFDTQGGSAVNSATLRKVFSSWNTGGDGSGQTISNGTTLKSDTSVYAIYDNPTLGSLVNSSSSRSVNLTLDADGGTVKNQSRYTKSYSLTLLGWYTAASGGSKYTSSYIVSANITLHAHWRSATVGSLPTATKSNKRFYGWFVGETKLTSSSTISANTTAVARYYGSPIWIYTGNEWIPYF